MHEMRAALSGKERICIEAFTLFGKYRIISVLGSGSTGTVYLAKHLKLEIFRAIKRIPKHSAGISSFSQKADFLTEARLLKNLNHPGIPLIYDIEEDNNYIYMIEEYIQGESLETYVLHPKDISQELIIKTGVQLCEILDYLHHLSPYPILYQDLKPEHIILCGDQLKLIDFGIAGFFTGSDNYFQLYGTEDFAAPEALFGHPVTTAADIFGIGKILKFLADAATFPCPHGLLHIIQCASDPLPQRRYPSASALKKALLKFQHKPHRRTSHLIRNLAVLGSRSGCGATHISIALACTLQQQGIPSLYQPMEHADILGNIAASNKHLKEHDGIFYYRRLRGVPNYGNSVAFSLPPDDCIVRDYGTQSAALTELEASDLILLVLSGSDWDTSHDVSLARQLSLLPQTVFLCNHGNKAAAKRLAGLLGQPVYCFPNDPDVYNVSSDKKQLFSEIFKRKGGFRHFFF